MAKVTDSEDCSESEIDSSLEVMGAVLGNPIVGDVRTIECLNNERMKKMLAKDLRRSEK